MCALCFYLGLVTRGFSTQQQLVPSTIKKFKKINVPQSVEGGLNGTHPGTVFWWHATPLSPACFVTYFTKLNSRVEALSKSATEPKIAY